MNNDFDFYSKQVTFKCFDKENLKIYMKRYGTGDVKVECNECNKIKRYFETNADKYIAASRVIYDKGKNEKEYGNNDTIIHTNTNEESKSLTNTLNCKNSQVSCNTSIKDVLPYNEKKEVNGGDKVYIEEQQAKEKCEEKSQDIRKDKDLLGNSIHCKYTSKMVDSVRYAKETRQMNDKQCTMNTKSLESENNYEHCFYFIFHDLLRLLKQRRYAEVIVRLYKLGKKGLQKDDYDLYAHTPYDSEVADEFGMEYVNASFVPMHDGKRFIPAQAPKEEYIQRFNEMLMKSDCNLVVCLIKFVHEGLVDYCSGTHTSTKDITDKDRITLVSKNTVLESMILGSRTYKRIMYDTWPDMSNPDKHLFDSMYKKFKIACKSSKNDIIVHCKAGLGRTGVFIFHQILTKLAIKDAHAFLVILMYLRSKRNHLVYTDSQLRFIYEYHIKD